MRYVIVPDALSEAINAKLDAAIADCPSAAADREHFYNELLVYFDEHGEIPEFTLERKPTADQPTAPGIGRS